MTGWTRIFIVGVFTRCGSRFGGGNHSRVGEHAGGRQEETKVAVITDVTAAIRDALTLPFQEKYGIPWSCSGRWAARSRRIAARRKAGRYLWDVFVHGTTTGLESMIPMGAFDPLEPALIFPDVKDAKTWRGGIEFLDPNKMLLTGRRLSARHHLLQSQARERERIQSHKDLLDQWKKADPR